jgi:hypothetical protein
MVPWSFTGINKPGAHKSSRRSFESKKKNGVYASFDFYLFVPKTISNFYAGRSYFSEMATADAIFHSDFDGASEMAPELPQHRHEARRSDCWPDWSGEVEEPAVTEAVIRENSPAIVFGDIVRLLGMTFILITVIDLSLKAFHLH